MITSRVTMDILASLSISLSGFVDFVDRKALPGNRELNPGHPSSGAGRVGIVFAPV
jgi:hypothetical protein